MAIIRKNTEQKERAVTHIHVKGYQLATQDGKKFIAYKLINEKGRLVDLRFTKNADTRDLEKAVYDGVTDFEMDVVGLNDASERFQYPRFYCDGIVGDIYC